MSSLHPIIAMALLPLTPPRNDGWQVVAKVFQRGEACDGCPRLCEDSEPRPYGEGVAYEHTAHCALGLYAKDRPEDCPGFEVATKGEDE